jgi:hypothetical protein
MDNRINEIHRKIRALRAEMVYVEHAMHDQIHRDLDCTAAALQLMELRKKLAALVAEWKAAGGSEPLPNAEQRLKASSRPKALTRC